MSVEGACQICTSEPVRHRRSRCEALVRAEHYDAATGLCTDRTAETGAGGYPD